MLCKLHELCANRKARFAHTEGQVDHDVPRVHGQAVPSLAPPRVYQSPRGAGPRLAGPDKADKLFFGDLILQKSVVGPVLPRP